MERTAKKTAKDQADADAADLDSLCEGISRAILEGLAESEAFGDDRRPGHDDTLAETGVIAPYGDMVSDRAVTTVEDLLESDEVSGRIMRIVQEKIEQVLNEDLAQSRRGDSGIIAERVHLECARLFGRESFRKELIRLLHDDVEAHLAPRLRAELVRHVRRLMKELAEALADEVAAFIRRVQEQGSSGPAPAPAAPPRPIALEPVPVLGPAPAPSPQARDHGLPAGRARSPSVAFERIRERLWAEGVL